MNWRITLFDSLDILARAKNKCVAMIKAAKEIRAELCYVTAVIELLKLPRKLQVHCFVQNILT